MLKRLLVKFLLMLAPLLLAAPSLATVVTKRGLADDSWVVEFVSGDTADSASINNTCASWNVSFDLGGGSAAATIYGINAPSVATGASGSTALTNGTLTVASLAAPVSVSTALPYLKVDVVSGPSSGTARVYLNCVKLASSGGSNPGQQTQGQYVYTTTPTTDNTAAPSATNIAGLSYAVAAGGQYYMHCEVLASSSTSTANGIRLGVTGPAIGAGTVSILFSTVVSPTNPGGTKEFASLNAYGVHNVVTGSGGTTRVIDMIDVVLFNGATAGTLQITLDTEIAAGEVVTAHTGSWCLLRTVA